VKERKNRKIPGAKRIKGKLWEELKKKRSVKTK
jgi:hypothetical protein